MSFRTGLLKVVNTIRGGIPRAHDLRQFTVTVVLETYTSDLVGEAGATKTTTSTPLTTGDGVTCPRVRNVSSRDAIASGGALTAQDLKVGPFTPAFAGGGVPESLIDPPVAAHGGQVHFVVTGPGMGATGRIFERINDDTLPNFSNHLYLRAIGRAA